MVAFVQANFYHDHWMKKNKIDPDYMHHKAMEVLQKAAVLEHRIRADDISAKHLLRQQDDASTAEDGSDPSAAAVQNETIADKIEKVLPDIQRFTYGFINGTKTIKNNNVCSAALLSTVDQAFKVIDVRFVWIPEYTVRFQTATGKLTDFYNTAYAYCNFAQFWANVSGIFNI